MSPASNRPSCQRTTTTSLLHLPLQHLHARDGVQGHLETRLLRQTGGPGSLTPTDTILVKEPPEQQEQVQNRPWEGKKRGMIVRTSISASYVNHKPQCFRLRMRKKGKVTMNPTLPLQPTTSLHRILLLSS